MNKVNKKNDYYLPDFILWDANQKKLRFVNETNEVIKVMKHSGKPFKSSFKTNTVKGFIFSPISGKPAYIFNEDNSFVRCDQCYVVDQKNTISLS